MTVMITPEDGSIVANANTYTTVAYVRAYNTQRGVELDDDDDIVASQIIIATDFVETYEARFQGDRVQPLIQSLSWPRMNALLYGNRQVPIPTTLIPVMLKNAVAYLVSVVADGTDLYAVQDSRAIIKEVIGPIETDYSATSGATVRPMIPNLEAILAPIVKTGVGSLTSVRV